MNRRQLLAAAGLSFTAHGAKAEPPTGTGTKKVSETWWEMVQPNFVVAYYFKDPGPDEMRQESGSDPFMKKGTLRMPSGTLLHLDGTLDVAGLAGRVQNHARVEKDAAKTIAAAVFDGTKTARIFECYDPHHVILFYNELGVPTGGIEICFTCQGVRVFPGGRPLINDCQDLRTVARLLSKSGLPLGERYKSLQDYETDWKERMDPDKKH